MTKEKNKDKIMKTKEAQKYSYKIEGEFIGFIPKPGGNLKYIQVKVGERIVPIKLAKKLRSSIDNNSLVKGDRLSISLKQSRTDSLRKLQLKSDRIEKISSTSAQKTSPTAVSTSSYQKNKTKTGKVLVCRKSSCAKRGGKKLYRALIEAIDRLELQQQVKVELTGCQKQCKKAPSLILMPGKVKHSYVNPHNLANLLQAHYL